MLDLHHGDCLEILPTIPTGSVDMVLADLPYGTTNCKWDAQIDLPSLWKEYCRVCSGPIVLFAQTPFDKVLGVSNLQMLRYEWIWEKTNPTGHLNCNRAPMKAHENILVFYDKAPTYNPQKTFGHQRKTATKRAGDTSPIYGAQNFLEMTYDSTERFPRSVQIFSSDKQRSKLHPTQKPVALCSYLIATYTNPGDLILDNVMGSGTTGVAALSSGRRFLGMELDATYFSVASERLENALTNEEAGQDA